MSLTSGIHSLGHSALSSTVNTTEDPAGLSNPLTIAARTHKRGMQAILSLQTLGESPTEILPQKYTQQQLDTAIENFADETLENVQQDPFFQGNPANPIPIEKLHALFIKHTPQSLFTLLYFKLSSGPFEYKNHICSSVYNCLESTGIPHPAKWALRTRLTQNELDGHSHGEDQDTPSEKIGNICGELLDKVRQTQELHSSMELLSQAAILAKEIPNAPWQGLYLTLVARAYFKINKMQEGIALLTQVNSIYDPSVYGDAAFDLSQKGHLTEAIVFFKKPFLSEDISYHYLYSIIERLIQNNQIESALNIIAQMNPSSERDRCCKKCISFFARRGQRWIKAFDLARLLSPFDREWMVRDLIKQFIETTSQETSKHYFPLILAKLYSLRLNAENTIDDIYLFYEIPNTIARLSYAQIEILLNTLPAPQALQLAEKIKIELLVLSKGEEQRALQAWIQAKQPAITPPPDIALHRMPPAENSSTQTPPPTHTPITELPRSEATHSSSNPTISSVPRKLSAPEESSTTPAATTSSSPQRSSSLVSQFWNQHALFRVLSIITCGLLPFLVYLWELLMHSRRQ